jgi:hypothetical protein
MDVDALMDRAIRGVKRTFGRPVSYSAGGVNPPVSLRAHWIREHVEEQPGLTVGASTTRDLLDFRAVDLTAAGIVPAQGDVVTFRAESWQVIDVQPGDIGTTFLHVARRGL